MNKKIKKKLIILAITMQIIIQISIILFEIYVTMNLIIAPGLSDYYIVEFNEENPIDEEDKKKICEVCNIEGSPKINKIAYEVPWLADSTCYVFFNGGNEHNSNEKIYYIYDEDGNFEQVVLEHPVLSAGTDKQYKVISKICDKYYKWWKAKEKRIDQKGWKEVKK